MMIRAFVFIALLIGVDAFISPISRVSSSNIALSMRYEKEIGAQPPLGFWDPLGLLDNADQERFDTLRATEIKHGRISMLAILGHIVTTSGVRFPGEIAFGLPFSSMKTGFAVLETIPGAGLMQLFFFIGLLELGFSTVQADIEEACENEMNRQKWSEAKQNYKRAIELNNGRAAQMGILGLMVHEKLDGNPYILNSIFGAPVPFN
jgi:hypothetical protein